MESEAWPCPLCGEPMEEDVRGEWVARNPERQEEIALLDEDQVEFVAAEDSAYHLVCSPRAIREILDACAIGHCSWWFSQHDKAGNFHSQGQRRAVVAAAEAVRTGKRVRLAAPPPPKAEAPSKADAPIKRPAPRSFRAIVEGRTYLVKWSKDHPYLYRRDRGKKDKCLGRVNDGMAKMGPSAIPDLVRSLRGV